MGLLSARYFFAKKCPYENNYYQKLLLGDFIRSPEVLRTDNVRRNNN